MKLTFIGACHQVTGSCFLLQDNDVNILVDCGMTQGVDALVEAELPVPPSEIDFILLTHAHIDHSGNIPLLYKNGFRGHVICSHATLKLAEIMLADSAYIQMSEANWINKHNKRSGHDEVIPPYTIEDAENSIKCFKSYEYNEWIQITPTIRVQLVDAGHLLGSSSIIVEFTDIYDRKKRIVFSGDIGNTGKPLLKDPEYLYDTGIDYVVMESTYGGRNHEKPANYEELLASIITKVLGRKGNLIIPSFAVGRTQELLYFIREIKKNKLVDFDFKVYVDSPLANEATSIYDRFMADYCNNETKELLENGINPIIFDGLVRTASVHESISIQNSDEPKVIISAAGMCDAGRIKHHLKHNLWRKECAIMFVGYQAQGTLGRAIVEGAPSVTIFGEQIMVSAEIIQFPGISAHADHDGLLRWINAIPNKPKKVFVVHGSDEACNALLKSLDENGAYDAIAPYSGSIFNLSVGSFEYVAPPIKNRQYNRNPIERCSKEYIHLLDAKNKLDNIVEQYKEGANKDILKFADQIYDLCDRWEC